MQMTHDKWVSTALRVSSETVTPQEVTQKLGLGADEAVVRGAPVAPQSPHPYISPRHLWIYQIDADPTLPIADHLTAAVGLLDDKAEAVRALALECDIEVTLGFGSETGQGGDVLPHDLLRRLANHPVALVLDLYPPESKHH